MIKKYFISNMFILLLMNVLVKPIWIFFIDRTVQLTVGHNEYGTYGALVSLTIIFNILLDVGITNYNSKSLAANNSLFETSFPNLIAAKAFLSLLYFIVVIVIASILHYSAREIYLLFLLAIVQALNSLLLFLRSNISANHHFKSDSFLSVFDKIVMIFICGYLLFFSNYKNQFVIEWFIYIQIAAYMLTILFAYILLIKKISKIRFNYFSFKEMIQLCKKSLPYAILIFLMSVYMRSDLLLLERMMGAKQNSIYLEAVRVLDAVNMIAFLFASMLLPIFARMLSQQFSVHHLVDTASNMIIASSLAFVAFCLVHAPFLMQLLYPADADKELIKVFSIVICSFPAFCIMYIYSTLLTANGNIHLLIKIALLGSIISILGNLILIPYLKITGSAIICFIVEWLVGLLYIYYCIKKLDLKFQFIKLVKMILLFVLMLIFNQLCNYFKINFPIILLSNGLLFLIIMYSIKLWDIKFIISLLPQYKSTK